MNGSAKAGTAAVRVVELGSERERIDLREADRWYVVLTSAGEPVLRVQTPSPGDAADGGIVELLLTRRADPVVWRRALTAELRQAFAGAPAEHAVRPTVSVLVCTHRRPQHLPFLLDALARLDPPPEEVIVVDNDPGDADCRELVERSGARYVREDRRGQDNARNAGLAVASGELVAFTDDDCVPSPGWLAHVAETFADPLVGVSTGPGFPWALDTPAQEHIEREGGFMRGLDRRVLDWRTLTPVHAGAAGAGANMIVRRSALVGSPAPWPPELGPGTPTESGDDTYVLSRFLAAGHRIVYDPRQWFQHQHRADWPALRRAVRGYGTGSACMLLKSLTEDGETEAPRGLSWIVRRTARARWSRVLGRADPVESMVAAEYLRGAAAGPGQLRASRRAATGTARRGAGLTVAAPREAFSAAAPADLAGDGRAIATLAVVVALEDGVDPAACLGAVLGGTAVPAEVITVGPEAEGPAGAGRHVRCAPEARLDERWAAGAAAVAGAPAVPGLAVLLLRASTTPGRALVAAHASWHARGAEVVIGARHVLPADDSLASSWAALAGGVHAGGGRDPAAPWGRAAADGNVSVGARVLATAAEPDAGPFSLEDLVRREAARGGRVAYDASATVAVTVRATPDELVGERRPVLALLAALERLRQRRLWCVILRRELERGAPHGPPASGGARLDLAVPQAGPDGEPPARLDVVLGGRPLGSVALGPRLDPDALALRVVELVDRAPHAWPALAIARGWSRAAPSAARPGRLAVLAAEVDPSVSAGDADVVALSGDGLTARVRAAARELAPGTEWLLVVAPGLRVGPELLEDVAPVLSATRLGCVYGSRSDAPLGHALSVGPGPTARELRDGPVDYVLVRASLAAGLPDAGVRRRGVSPRAVLLELVDRAAGGGWLAGRLDVRGLSPHDPRVLAGRHAAHRFAVGWWLGARVRASAAGAPRRAAVAAAGAELLAAGDSPGRLVAGLLAGLRVRPPAPGTAGAGAAAPHADTTGGTSSI